MAGDGRLSARFGADTSDFKNGISEINRELKVVESGFRASAAALGDWSDSSAGLEMRIGSLTEKLSLQQEKVDALRYRYEELKAAKGETSVEAQNAQIALNKETESLNKMQVELKETTDALDKMGDEAKSTGSELQDSGAKVKSFGEVVSSVKNVIKDLSVTIAGVAVLVKKALDFGAEGAQIVQLEESFTSLTDRIGVTTDVLGELSAASRNTVDEGDLMAAMMKMMTGTSEEMSRTLLEGAPALMEIAKASNKLNPTMGSTLELFESMSTSIKNLTPRGLKQAGIVVDTTEVYKAYADSIGKAVDQLTEEDQSMALLEATLAKGKDILAQVGGNTVSATDRFERANVAIENLKETIQVKLVPVLGDAATGLNTVLGSSDTSQITTAWGNFFNTMITKGMSAAEIADAYNQKAQDVNKTFSDQSNVVDKAIVGWIKLTEDESKFLSDQAGLQQALLMTSSSLDEYWTALVQANGGNADLIDLNNPIMKALKAQADAQYNAAHAADTAGDATKDLVAADKKAQETTKATTKNTIDLANSYTTLTSAAQEYGLSSDELGRIQDTLTLFVGGLGEQLNTTATDMELMAEATALGIVGATDYASAMFDAANGLQVMSDAERESLQASVAAEQAKRNQALAVQAASQSYLDLASSLKGATSAQIAETAIQGLSELQKAGKIDFSTYFTAVSGLQESFGLSDEKSRALAAAMPVLNDALVSGVLPATNFDDALKAMIKDSADGNINLDTIINKFGQFPTSISTAVESFTPFDEKMTDIPESAATSAQGAIDAFTTADWEGAGIAVDNEIAQGITAGTPAITAAVKEAIQAAINAATAAGTTGPTPTSPPPSIPGYASGGYGQVPPGYPNDSYLIGLTSGEEFLVNSAGGLATALSRMRQDLALVTAGVNATSVSAAAGAGHSSINIAPGAINVYASPGMDEEALAQNVIDKLGDTLEVARSKGVR